MPDGLSIVNLDALYADDREDESDSIIVPELIMMMAIPESASFRSNL